MKRFKQFVNENINDNLKVSDLPEVPKELTNMLMFPNSRQFRNRIIVNIDGDWFDYNKSFYSEPEWSLINYDTDSKERDLEIIFDQDVLEGSEIDKVSKEFKKWLESEGFKVSQVYLGET